MRRLVLLLTIPPLIAPLLLLVLVSLPSPCAAAEEPLDAVIVLDRGRAAKERSEGDSGNVLRIGAALRGLQREVLVVALGRDAKGRVVTVSDAPSAAWLTALDEDEDFAFRGPSSAAEALEAALGLRGGEDPVDIVLVGPFGGGQAQDEEGGEKDDGGDDGQAEKVLQALAGWNADAPAGSRILPVGLSDRALAELKDARGLVPSGALVLGVGKPEVQVDAFSPLPESGPLPAPLTASIRVLADVVSLGAARPVAVVQLRSDVAEDELETKLQAGLHDFRLERRQRDGRTATLAFKRADAEGEIWYGTPPEPLTFRWEKLKPDVLLVGPEGEVAPAFAAIDAEAGTPVAVSCRLRRSRSGPPPAWRVGTTGAPLPQGLQVEVGDEVTLSPEVAEAEVRVRFIARVASPLDVKGVITLQAAGVDETLELPYTVRVQPGRATLEVRPQPQRVPAAQADENTSLQVVTADANVPAEVRLEAVGEATHLRWLTALVREPGGAVRRWKLNAPIVLPVDLEHELSFELHPDAAGILTWPCEVTVRAVPTEGLDVAGAGVIQIRAREPRLVIVDPDVAYEQVDGEVIPDRPLQLRVVPDGGDGDWLVGLLQEKPRVSVEGQSPIEWEVTGKGPGVWEIAPTGSWDGPSPKIFNVRTVPITLNVTWSAGQGPSQVSFPIHVQPRWGVKGYVLVGLAGLAVVLALLILLQMRSAAVEGTLIYTVKGLEGTVGRLDLAPVGHRTAQICSDERGRLSLGKTGEPIARITPTRVGGMLEALVGEDARDRRLLVDGLSLQIGRHIVRYVSGQAAEAGAAPDPVPDLLGEEYDIETGRIDALGDAHDDA